MRVIRSWFGATAVAVSVCWMSALSLGQEPGKATATPTEGKPSAPAPGHSVHGEPFNEGPRSRAYLMDGQGQVHFPVTTSKAEAQAFVDQGVAQLHTFAYFESERSFRQAAMLDPTCAMAYWGLGMSNVNNPKRGRGFLKEARKRIGSVSRRERLYIEALEAFFREAGSDKDRRQGWLTGLEAVVQEFPEDLDARAWVAMTAWQNAAQDGVGSRQAVDTLIGTVLEKAPRHPGALHYRIHLWDEVKAVRAEQAAALYAVAVPGIAHAWHMPGHTYTDLKRYADAAYQQEGSARVDHAYMMRDRVMPFEIHNYAHNNQWLCTSYSHIGRVRDAVAVARNLVEQPRDPQKNNASDGGSPQRNGRIRWAEALMRYELWDELVSATTSGAIDWSDLPTEKVSRAHTLGRAYVARNETAKLAAEIQALRTLKTDEAKSPLAELQGYERLSRGEIGPAFEQFAKATSMRAEALARAHLKARNFGLAESVARRDVDRNPGQVPPLAALVEVLFAVGKGDEALEAYRKLEPLAKWADRDLPVLRRVRAAAAEWKPTSGAHPAPSATAGAGLNGSEESSIHRIDLATLGPLVWSPFKTRPLSGTDTAGRVWSLEALRKDGKGVLVIFFLGGKCAHCMQQLQLFGQEYEALRRLNFETLAVSTDDVASSRALKNNPDGVKFPMPFLSDPELREFRKHQAFDEFENLPLHATFLIDRLGDVRFQRISADPFLEVEFIKAEAARVNRLIGRN